MLRVLSCVTQDHDYRLLALAISVCAVGAWIGIKTFIKARQESWTGTPVAWLLLSSISMASAIWATHFVAMLAFRPGLRTGWDVGLSLISLLIAVAATGGGLMIAINRRLPLAPELGGIVLGVGIAAMHFTGMRALQVNGRIAWDASLVEASLGIGLFFGILSLSRAARPVTRFCKYGGTLALVLAICGLHFTAMAAVTIVPDPTLAPSSGALADATFAYVVACVAMIVIGTSCLSYVLDLRTSSAAMARMRKLANATTEGILIVRNGVVTDANDRLVSLLGVPLDQIVGSDPASLWDRRARDRGGLAASDFDSEITAANGEHIPVHVTAAIASNGEAIYAIRDLRAKRADEARIRHMANHDPLTGLANRSSFAASVDAAIEAGDPFAILYIDLDRFKEINDTNGHAAGDAVLVEMARRMTDAGEDATVARIGGDEFAILQPLDTAAANDNAEALAEALTKPFLRNGTLLRTGGSIGVSRFPQDGRSRTTLVGNADMAMYAAKADRKSGIRRFDPKMGEAMRRRRLISHDLAFAIPNGQMEVYYQVQTAIVSGQATGFEALVRWQHPVLGAVSPGEFIPVAEENGTIGAIGAWVMRQACRDAVTWPDGLRIAVNLSPAQFDGDIEGMIRSALAETGLEPHRLEVEITESLLINDLERTLSVLRCLKDMGVSIAMDDFGTGYSSLSTLQAFPFDKIKIDRSFVDKLDRSPQAAAIVHAVVNLGLSLNIPVLAEGVETQVHLDFLKKHGCTAAQGFLMGRPTPLAGTQHHIMSKSLAAA